MKNVIRYKLLKKPFRMFSKIAYRKMADNSSVSPCKHARAEVQGKKILFSRALYHFNETVVPFGYQH